MARNLFTRVRNLVVLISLCLLTTPVTGQTDGSATPDSVLAPVATVLNRLDYIQTVLSQKRHERSQLGELIEAANEQDKTDLRRQADDITQDIRRLKRTFEIIAIGDVDTRLFVEAPEKESQSWREDITLIAQPVIESLKELTEKPRKLKELNDAIAERTEELGAAREALENLESVMSENPAGELQRSLNSLERTWRSRRDNAQSAIDIARFQIADLRGDKTLLESILTALGGFLTGRGLTILLAVLAAYSVWYGIRFLLRGYRNTLVRNETPESRTRYRLAAYSLHAFTGTLIITAVFVVLYQRSDVLLLGLLVMLIFGLALGIRQLLPQYIREARLLLNIGPMREAERVIYRGLPWRVESINMFSILHNPELNGSLRLPLADFHGVSSRPSDNDSWFPTSCGDVVLCSDERLLEVIHQNPDTVELQALGGQMISIPSSEFYNYKITNLSRGGTFGVTDSFRLDYVHQSISREVVPRILRKAIQKAFDATALKHLVTDVEVELQTAGDSAINYWLFVTAKSPAAKSYLEIRRIMQSACISACLENEWQVPYPHVALVRKMETLSGGWNISGPTTNL
ncbi:MAG: hypothetical protein AB8B63_11840 [Granulosicoccus sp.]